MIRYIEPTGSAPSHEPAAQAFSYDDEYNEDISDLEKDNDFDDEGDDSLNDFDDELYEDGDSYEEISILEDDSADAERADRFNDEYFDDFAEADELDI